MEEAVGTKGTEVDGREGGRDDQSNVNRTMDGWHEREEVENRHEILCLEVGKRTGHVDANRGCFDDEVRRSPEEVDALYRRVRQRVVERLPLRHALGDEGSDVGVVEEEVRPARVQLTHLRAPRRNTRPPNMNSCAPRSTRRQ
eukprot:6196398-Pleurochrysis_carterae.AAC.2